MASPTSETTTKVDLFGFTDVMDCPTKSQPGHVEIRSYAQFTFASPPPFGFILPPDTDVPEQKLQFFCRQKGEAWGAVVSPNVKPKGDPEGCVEIQVGGSKSDEAAEKIWCRLRGLRRAQGIIFHRFSNIHIPIRRIDQASIMVLPAFFPFVFM